MSLEIVIFECCELRTWGYHVQNCGVEVCALRVFRFSKALAARRTDRQTSTENVFESRSSRETNLPTENRKNEFDLARYSL